jgi:hypothetical protein
VNSAADLTPARDVGNDRKRGVTIYHDGFPMGDAVRKLAQKADVLTPQVYRNPGETSEQYARRLTAEYDACESFGECWPTVNIHRRYGPTGPTLSVRDVVDGFVTATQMASIGGWPGMVLFRVGTMDMPAEVLPYIDRFLSGITATPDARIIHQPLPEVTDMIYLPSLPTPTTQGVITTTVLGTKVPQSDGCFAIKAPNGKWVTLRADGTWDTSATQIREWEKFWPNKAGGGMMAPGRDGKTFWIQSLED